MTSAYRWSSGPRFADATAYRVWACPRCTAVHLLLYKSERLFPQRLAPNYRCERCNEESPSPWPNAIVRQWKCEICGNTDPDWVELCSQSPDGLPILGGGFLSMNSNECTICRKGPKQHPYESELTFLQRLDAAFWGGVAWEADPNPSLISQNRAARVESDKLLQDEIQRLEDLRRERMRQDRVFELSMQSLEKLLAMSPSKFEDAVAYLFAAMDWEVYWTRGGGDHGIDLVLIQSKKRAAVQCKRYRRLVGEPAIRGFFGSFSGVFSEGYFVTTSTFTPAAKAWAKGRKRLHLVDGLQLVELMTEHEPRVVERREYKG